MAHRLDTQAALDRIDEPAAGFDWTTAPTHCRLSFLRGLFLAHGSLSLSAGRTHLEFDVPLDRLATIGGWLADVGLPAGSRVRRGRGVLTWKSAETVVGFLRRIGGTGATLELDTLAVKRSLRAHLNRVVNAESANVRRSVASSRRQLASIEALAASGELERLPPRARAIARARLEAPEATYTELAGSLGISRALLQRGLLQLEERALQVEGTTRPASGSAAGGR